MNFDAELTKRELEVAEALAFVPQRQKAAEKLFISEGTLAAHSYRIYEKLEVHSKTELLIWWMVTRLGIKKDSIPYFRMMPVMLISIAMLLPEVRSRRRSETEICERMEQTDTVVTTTI